VKQLALLLPSAMAAAAAILSCAPSIKYASEIPNMKPLEKKALVKIVRPVPEKGVVYNSEKLGLIYLDGIIAALTTVNTVVMFQADAGTHYITAKIDNVSVVKLTMQPGRTYYLVQNISPVPISAPTPGFGRPSGGLTRVDCALDLVSPDEFSALLNKNKGAVRYAAYDRKRPVQSMDRGEKRESEAGYEYWAKSNPDQARKHYEYMGY
jgi:hypothetical protein